MAVEVGFVEGITAATTPTGAAISMIPFSRSSRIMPTVRHVANGARNVDRGEAVLGDFVGNVAVAGFFDGEARERFAGFGGGVRAGFDDGVNLLLGECGELLLGFVGPLDGLAGFLDGNQVAIAQAQRTLPDRALPRLDG